MISWFTTHTYMNKEEYHQVVRLEQTVLEMSVDYKGFVIPLLLYSMIYTLPTYSMEQSPS